MWLFMICDMLYIFQLFGFTEYIPLHRIFEQDADSVIGLTVPQMQHSVAYLPLGHLGHAPSFELPKKFAAYDQKCNLWKVAPILYVQMCRKIGDSAAKRKKRKKLLLKNRIPPYYVRTKVGL